MDDFDDLFAICRTAFDQRLPDATRRARLLLATQEGLIHRYDAIPIDRLSSADADARRKASVRASALRDLLVEYVKFQPRDETPNLVPTDRNKGRWLPTPETVAKASRRIDPISSLTRAGRIDSDQAAAARRIALIAEVISSCQHAKVQNFDRVGGGAHPIDTLPESLAVEHGDVYLPWATRLRVSKAHPNHLDLVLKVAVDGLSLDSARRDYHLGYSRSVELLRDGLDLFIDYADRAKRARDQVA